MNINPKYANAPIFQRRREEWTKEKIQDHVDKLFENIESLDGFKYIGSSWIDESSKDANGERKRTREELKKSTFSILKVNIENAVGREFEYYIQFPDLIYNQFFYIGGILKVPVFQMFDLPVLYRKVGKNNYLLKVRNNVLSLTVDLNRKDEHTHIQLFGKDIPFDLLLACFHTREELDQFVEAHPNMNELLKRIIEETYAIHDQNISEENRSILIGEYYSTKNSDNATKGSQILFSLKTAYDVDHFSRKFFKTNSLLFELLHAIYEGIRSDTDMKYKRIRFSEYIFAPLVYKMYDMVVTFNKHKKDKYQIPQNIILEACSYTDGKDSKTAIANIVHYNYPINPIGEIANLLQCSLVGPGGFKKSNVPPHLRDIDDSQFGYVCAADTPDRDGCGVSLNLVPTVDLNEDGTFGTPDVESIVSFPISCVPFLQNDDPTRLQMASNQNKQTILLSKTEKPLIRSGNENLYLDETTFMETAKDDGIILYKDDDYLIVKYNNDKIQIFNIGYRSLYVSSLDSVVVNFSKGEKFKKGDIVYQSKFIKNGELSLGHNFFTAITIYEGFNYEDGIVIAESVVDKMKSIHSVDLSYQIESGQILLSLEDDKYNPIPPLGTALKKGQSYAKIKNLDWESGIESINAEPFEKTAPLDCVITSIKIFPNSWNKKIVEFNTAIQERISEQLSRYNTIVHTLTSYLDEIEIEKLLSVSGISSLKCDTDNIGSFYNKRQKIGGIQLSIDGIYTENISTGDKLANRHGNKGVIAKVVPDAEMPVTEDGRQVEIIINPLGIISRMNPGQLFELHLGEALHQLKQKMHTQTEEKCLKYLEGFLNILDMTKEKWVKERILSEFKENLEKKGIEKAIDRLYCIAPPFESPGPEELIKLMKYTKSKFKRKLMYKGEAISNDVACGYVYFHKLVHRSSDKISARSLGPYNKKTSQPLGGKANTGGHRLGEMEVWALLAHGCDTFLKDLLTIHSDSVGLKNQTLSKLLENPSLMNEEELLETTPQSLKIMEAYLNIAGLCIEDGEEEKMSDIFRQDEFK